MELYTVTQQNTGEAWTRNTLNGARGLADTLAESRGQIAIVTLTETGWEEYRSKPGVDEIEQALVVSESL